MADFAFVADRTIPGLSARDLARRAADAITVAFGGSDRQADLRQAFRGTDRRLLQDIGIDRRSC